MLWVFFVRWMCFLMGYSKRSKWVNFILFGALSNNNMYLKTKFKYFYQSDQPTDRLSSIENKTWYAGLFNTAPTVTHVSEGICAAYLLFDPVLLILMWISFPINSRMSAQLQPFRRSLLYICSDSIVQSLISHREQLWKEPEWADCS